MEYFEDLKTIKYNDIIKNNYIITPSNFKKLLYSNTLSKLRDHVNSYDIGKEVGSSSYVEKSDRYFIRPRAFHNELYTLVIEKESVVPIIPQVFKNYNLKKGDILISKDSNVGECVILEKDYSEYTIAGAVVRLKTDDPYVIIGLLKHPFFKNQFDINIPRGVTIKHAKTVFLDFLVPYPTNEKDKKIAENIVKDIVQIEDKIKDKFILINKIITDELHNNSKTSNYSLPRYNEVKDNTRLTAGIYSKEYKECISLIKNYKYGFFTIPEEKFAIGFTPKLRVVGEGNKRWITPTIICKYGYLIEDSKILCKESNIQEDCILIINRTSKEGAGEYVGVSMFYDYKELGVAQYNQGLYKLSVCNNFIKEDLLLLVCLLNSPIYRTIFKYLSIGAKMDEIKIYQLTKLPFPKFPEEVKEEIIKLYNNDNEKELGILQLSYKKFVLENCLKQMIDSWLRGV